MLLSAPKPASLEVIGDANYFIANFWRAVKFQPDAVWAWQDYPVSHVDLCARHKWLTQPDRTTELAAALDDPDWPGDPKIAGWWVWGQCCWIGSGWCVPRSNSREWDQTPHVSNAGRGLQAHGQVPHVSDAGRGDELTPHQAKALIWLRNLSARLSRVRVVHGTWNRCLNHHYGKEKTAIFLDPPYKGFTDLYGAKEVASEVEDWAREHPGLRIALCGHIGDYDLPGWSVHEWSRGKLTYSGGGTTEAECIWFSPGCVPETKQIGLGI